MEKPLVSVIILTHKRPPEMLLRAVRSAIAQSYRNLEILVVDDSPPDYPLRDDVMRALDGLDDRLRYLRHAQNMGVSAARNTGIRNANGEYIAFLSDDDEWLPEKTAKQLERMLSSGADAVYCRYYTSSDQTTTINKTTFCRGHIFDEVFTGLSPLFALYRRACFEAVGLYDEGVQLMEDRMMWLRIAKSFTFDYVDEPLVILTKHSMDQLTKHPERLRPGYEMIEKEHSEYLKAHRAVHYGYATMVALRFAHYKIMGMAWRYFSRAVILKPFSFRNNFSLLRRLLWNHKELLRKKPLNQAA